VIGRAEPEVTMSRHVPRGERWSKVGPTEYRSVGGLRTFFERGAWWAEVAYRLRPDDALPGAFAELESHADRLGPFKRPRNAQVESERHATFLQRRYGGRIILGPAA
jgi:hypothetical protein